jgi:hypothetical protein
MSIRFAGTGKLAILGVAVVAALAMPLGASARGWGGGHGGHGAYHGGYSGAYYGHGGYGHGSYHRGGHWEGGRWIAGAIVAGAVVGLISDVTRPAPVYYGAPVIYSQPGVVYESYYPAPVVRRRVVETRTVVYEDPYQTRYVGSDDGY